MNNLIDIENILHGALVKTDKGAFTFEATNNPRALENQTDRSKSLDWTEQANVIGEWTIFPYGLYDDLPKEIKDTVQKNDIAPGVLKKKTQLLWGASPALYRVEFEKGIRTRVWVEDKEVQDWLNTWDYEDYLLKSTVDFHNLEATTSKIIRDRASRLKTGKSRIARLEQINPEYPRLAKKTNNKSPEPTHIVYKLNNQERLILGADYKIYPIFDIKNPTAHATSAYHSNLYSFGSSTYTVPDICGTLEWLKISTTVTLILTAMSRNSINVKYHIISPQKYWDTKEKQLKDAATDANPYKDQDLINYRDTKLREIAHVLSGAENVGKFWHSIKYYEIDGMKIFEHGWEIKEIKQNIKEFITSQEVVRDVSSRAIGASMGVHQSLGGSGEKSKTDSGGEQLYAYKNFMATGVTIPEMIICKVMNYALKVNFPEKKLKMGFYHQQVQKEQDVSPNKRFKENV